ncbi:PEF-CTERM sorting domain-containing protein [Methanosarcina sp. Mfa9]|uniref:PEF-CTERM sorting domain-containing protein n=1 Tax=Methanosarcina sp. Mfa9 TaxID=3439063 RepID=UPI003F86BB34
MANPCSAAVSFDVSPGTKYVQPGGTAIYDLAVFLDTPLDYTVDYPITEKFAIDLMISDWVYSFSEDSVILDLNRTTNTSVLEITVPFDAVPGNYSHKVTATGYDKLGKEIDYPSEFDIYVINTNVNVPEFPTVALPMLAVFGLVAIFGRRNI